MMRYVSREDGGPGSRRYAGAAGHNELDPHEEDSDAHSGHDGNASVADSPVSAAGRNGESWPP